MQGPGWKTLASAGIPLWITAVAWILFAGGSATIFSILIIALSGVGSLGVVAARPRLLRLLLVPRGFETELSKAAQTVLNDKVAGAGKVIPNAEKVADEITKQIASYFEQTFEQIESDFRAGRVPDLEYAWYLLVGSLASLVALIVVVGILVTPSGSSLLSVVPPTIGFISVGLLATLGTVCLFVALSSRRRLARYGIVSFPLLLTASEYERLDSFAKLATTLEQHGHPLTATSQALADIRVARTKGFQQRQALVSSVVENTSADPAFVMDVFSYVVASLIALVLVGIFLVIFYELYWRYLRFAGLINIAVGGVVAARGLQTGDDLETILGLGFLGTGVGLLVAGSIPRRRTPW